MGLMMRFSFSFPLRQALPSVGFHSTSFASLVIFPALLSRPRYIMALEKRSRSSNCLSLDPGDVLLSRAVASQVPSALRGLTSVFGMGTGGSLSLLSPEISCALSRPASLSRFRLLCPPRFRSAAFACFALFCAPLPARLHNRTAQG